MSLRHTIGSAIKEARILEGITREELAERLNGWSAYELKAVENGGVDLNINDYELILSKLKYGECYRFVKVETDEDEQNHLP